jgi:hypothetical protein
VSELDVSVPMVRGVLAPDRLSPDIVAIADSDGIQEFHQAHRTMTDWRGF